MLNLRLLVVSLSVSVMAIGAGTVSGQDYPNKPIRMVTSAIGGGNDFAARIVAQGLAEAFGHQVIVDNRLAFIFPVRRPMGITCS